MAAGLEITDVRRLEVAHCETALLPRVAGFWLVRVLPSMVQEEEHSGDKERPCYDEEHHAPGVLRLTTNAGSVFIISFTTTHLRLRPRRSNFLKFFIHHAMRICETAM